ncbi:MAG: RNHCP domain-containing protein [bacterium]|nr:RNHCP domain-containing protein [bacterium]
MHERKNFYNSGNDTFVCEQCNKQVAMLFGGGFRNHCRYCLWCKHVDIVPGDRKEKCKGLMKPIGIDQHSKKGWMIIHRCTLCAIERRNKMAEDDHMETLLQLML